MSSDLPKECQDGTCYYWLCGLPCDNEPANEEVYDGEDYEED